MVAESYASPWTFGDCTSGQSVHDAHKKTAKEAMMDLVTVVLVSPGARVVRQTPRYLYAELEDPIRSSALMSSGHQWW